MAPRGRPPEMDRAVAITADGVEVSAAAKVVEMTRLGLDQGTAATAAGINRVTLHRWRLEGSRARAIEAQGKRALTEREERLRDFCNDLERAVAAWEADCLSVIHAVGNGGIRQVKVTEKYVGVPVSEQYPEGRKLVERTETEEFTAPQWTAKAWLLERRMKQKYGRHLEVTANAGLVPEDEAARGLADSLREYLQGVEDGRKAASPKRRAIPAESREAL
jgi:hypothetical protein